jgi:hypothetical protein
MNIFKNMTLRANESAMKEAAKEISQRKHKNLSFRFLLIVALVSITMGSFFIACSSDNDYAGLEVNANEKSLNLKAPNGEKIADNILQLKEIVSVSVAERFGIDKDFDITSLEYYPVPDGYVVLIQYRTLDDIEGGIVRTNSPSILASDGIISTTVRLKAWGENTVTVNITTYTCRPTSFLSDCNCKPHVNTNYTPPKVTCYKDPSTCTGTCERIPPLP